MHFASVRLILAILAVSPVAIMAQATGSVRGTVTDVGTGQPIASAQIRIDGTTIGALSGQNGEYLIPAAPVGQRVVIARRIGYGEVRRTVIVEGNGTATANFAMSGVAVTLGEVVVTGTGAPTEKRAVGNSIGSVDSASIQRASATTIDQALQGKIAGAQISQNSGNPGGGGISVRLRGTSSFISGSDPLYIVDGVIVDNSSATLRDLGARSNVQNRLADLNPADIARIEIIRGAAAAALYGSRANNGVVQIFTKRGSVGKTRVTYQTRVSTSEAPTQLGINNFSSDAAGLPVATRIDLQDQIFRRGSTYENNLSLDGGTDQTRYYINGTWTDEKGIFEKTSSSRKGGRINLTQTITPKLNLDLGANFVNTHNEFQVNGEATGVLTSFLFNPTTFNPSPVDGVFPFAPILNPNPLLQLSRFRNPQDINRFIGSVQARWNPLSRLALNYTFGYDGYSLEQSEFIPRGALPAGPTANGLSANSIRNSRILNQDATANYVTPWRDFQFTTSGGFNYTEQRLRTTSAAATDLIPVVEVVGGATPSAFQSIIDLKTLGFYAQEAIAWRDRLYLSGAIRWDASSTFGPNERWQIFPKASISYVLSEEEWFRSIVPRNAVSSLRLRTALGYAGNQPSVINAYSRFDDYVSQSFDGKPGLVNSVTLGNTALKPERQREWELGGDFGFLNDRASLEATYYDKVVEDLLFFRPVSRSTGYTRQFSPIGSLSNKGWEFLLRTINVDRPAWKWDMTMTYTRNRNRVESLDIPDFQSASGYPNRIKKGDPVGVFYGTYAARNCVTGNFLLDSLGRLRPSTSLPASIDSRRALSGGSCNDSSAAVLGDPNPDWLGSWLNEFGIGKHFRFRVLLDGSFGGDVLNLSGRIRDLGGASNSPEAERELIPFGDSRRLPAGYLARRLGIFSEYVEDGTFVKLREISASYNFDSPWITRFLSQGVELSLSGRNLYTWTDYEGYDPEVNAFGQNADRAGSTAADRGFDFATIPIPRTWSIGARFTY